MRRLFRHGKALFPLRRNEQRQEHRADAGGPQLRGAGDAGAHPQAEGGHQGQRRPREPSGRPPPCRSAGAAGHGPGGGRPGRQQRGPASGLCALRREPVPHRRAGRAAVHGDGRAEHPRHLLRPALRLLPQGLPRLHPASGAGPHHRGDEDHLHLRPQGHLQLPQGQRPLRL